VLQVGLLAAREHSTLVVVLNIDPRTRAAKVIHTPFLALLDEERLGVGLFGRDADGLVRRFSLAVPTQEGSFPTLPGRLCRLLSRNCREGFIDFAFGPPFRYVPFHDVLATKDPEFLAKLFKGRIVLVGEVQRYANRIEVPVNRAGWEDGGPSSPGVVVHAAALRTALYGNPPQEAGKPYLLVLVSLCALLVFMRDWRLALVTAVVAAAVLFVLALAALRSGLVLDLAPPLLTLALAWAATCRIFGTRFVEKAKDPHSPPKA